MITLMRGTAACPDFILRAGKYYDLPRALAKRLCGIKMAGAVVKREEKNGKEVSEVVWAGPAAEIVTPDKLPKKAKILRMAIRPDPSDVDTSDMDADEFEDLGDAPE